MSHEPEDEELSRERVTGGEGSSLEGEIEDWGDGEGDTGAATPGEGPSARGRGRWRTGQRIDHYELASHIAAGGYAEVWLAIDVRINAPVALKLLHPEHARSEQQRARFKREAEIMGRLASAHILRVEEPGFDAEHPYLKYRVLNGETLGRRLARAQAHKLSVNEASRLFTQLLRALAVVHRAQVVHRDVKPSNIFLERLDDGALHVVLFDFGIAADLREGAAALTAENHTVGTPAFMSPEARAANGPPRPARDVYAAASIFYEMISGQRLFAGMTNKQIAESHARGETIPLLGDTTGAKECQLPDALASLIDKALAVDEAERPADAQVFLDRFLAAAAFNPEMLAGRKLVGRYTLHEKLGQGGMGIVYRATDGHTQRAVALKLMHIPSYITGQNRRDIEQRFDREATILMQLRHTHVASIADKGIIEGHPFYVMELIEGASLREARETLSWAEATTVIAQTAEALDCAAQAGVVHRDVKLENIMVRRSGNGEVSGCLIDFGIARIEGSALTKEDAHIGTPGNRAPEQRSNAAGVTGKTDQWGLASVVYELLLGEPPTHRGLAEQGAEPPNTRVELQRGLQELPATVARVLERALAPRPEDRFATTTEFARALCTTAGELVRLAGALPSDGQLAQTTSEHGTTPMASEVTRGSAKRSRLPSVAVTALLAVGLAVGAWWFDRSAEKGAPADIRSATSTAADDTRPDAALENAEMRPSHSRTDAATADATPVVAADVEVIVVTEYAGRARANVKLTIDGKAMVSPATLTRKAGAMLRVQVRSARFTGKETLRVPDAGGTLPIRIRKRRKKPKPDDEPVEDIIIIDSTKRKP